MDDDCYPTPPPVDVANGDGSAAETCRDFLRSAVGRMNNQQEWFVERMRDHGSAVREEISKVEGTVTEKVDDLEVKLAGVEAALQAQVEQNRSLEDQVVQKKSLEDKLAKLDNDFQSQVEQNKSLARKNEYLELELKRMEDRSRKREQNMDSLFNKLQQRLENLETASSQGMSDQKEQEDSHSNLNPAKTASVGARGRRFSEGWSCFRVQHASLFRKPEVGLLQAIPGEWAQVPILPELEQCQTSAATPAFPTPSTPAAAKTLSRRRVSMP